MVVQWSLASQLPLHILLTKADKLKHGAASTTLLQVRKRLQEYEGLMTAQLFSALNGKGVDELRKRLDSWLITPDMPDITKTEQ